MTRTEFLWVLDGYIRLQSKINCGFPISEDGAKDNGHTELFMERLQEENRFLF